MRDPSCEIAGAGARVAPSSTKVAGSIATLARIARKPSGPPVPATSSVDSNATIRPSPLIEGLMLIPSSVVFVMRRSGRLHSRVLPDHGAQHHGGKDAEEQSSVAKHSVALRVFEAEAIGVSRLSESLAGFFAESAALAKTQTKVWKTNWFPDARPLPCSRINFYVPNNSDRMAECK